MRITSVHFNYDTKTKTFSEEISTLTGGNYSIPWSRLYQDACDVGIFLVSERTGKVVRYYLAETKQDREGDIQYWMLVPVSEDVRKNPGAMGTKIMIWND